MALRSAKSLYEYILEHPECENLFDEYCDDNIIPIDQISIYNTNYRAHWYCKKHNHEFFDYTYNRVRYPKAPCCSGKVATENDNFALNFPELLKDWDYSKNIIDPKQLKSFSHQRVYWKCHDCKYEWDTKLYSRTINYNKGGGYCPNCTKIHTSRAEMMIISYLKLQFPNTTKIKGYTDSNGNKHPELDIFIPELKIAIEYDGYPWHLSKLESHINKLEYCKKNNIILINIAEYKDDKSLELVKKQYNGNIVMYYKIDSTYSLDSLLYEFYKYMGRNGVKLPNPNTINNTNLNESVRQYTKTCSSDGSLLNELPWIKNWYSSENDISIDKISHGSQSEILLTCPNCGYTRKIKAHWIKKQFTGCSKCKCREDIPEEHLERIRKFNAEAYQRRKDSLKEKRELKKQEV